MSEKIVLKNKEQLEKCLKVLFDDINQVDEFIICAHQVNNHRDAVADSDPMLKLDSILKSGLYASRYGSIDGTVRRMGSSKDKSVVKNVADYNYHVSENSKTFPTVILALPRFIDVDGQKVEYASSDYIMNDETGKKKLRDMLETKKSRNRSPDNQHTAKCWADVLKGFKDFHVNDSLCAFYQEEDSGNYVLILPNVHWAYKPTQEYKDYKQRIANKIKCYDKSLEDAIVHEENKRYDYINSLYDDFD